MLTRTKCNRLNTKNYVVYIKAEKIVLLESFVIVDAIGSVRWINLVFL